MANLPTVPLLRYYAKIASDHKSIVPNPNSRSSIGFLIVFCSKSLLQTRYVLGEVWKVVTKVVHNRKRMDWFLI
jgi:hypothetical protein